MATEHWDMMKVLKGDDQDHEGSGDQDYKECQRTEFSFVPWRGREVVNS